MRQALYVICGLLYVLAELWFIINLIYGPFFPCESEKILPTFSEKGPFITLGRNVAAKLDEKHVEKCHRLWDKILQ